mgnify:CR=1 FL=1
MLIQVNAVINKNGEKVYSDNSATRAIDLSSSCYIGYSWEPGRWLPGEISEVRVWNVARTAEEIASNPYMVDPHSEGLLLIGNLMKGLVPRLLTILVMAMILQETLLPLGLMLNYPNLKNKIYES